MASEVSQYLYKALFSRMSLSVDIIVTRWSNLKRNFIYIIYQAAMHTFISLDSCFISSRATVSSLYIHCDDFI